MRLGALVSGRGSNLEAVLGAALPGIDPVLVISNRAGVPALTVAARHDVPARVMARSSFGGDASLRDGAIGDALTAESVELVLLAGYDQLLRPSYFAAYPGRTINIHPSLLPAHAGMAGLAVHRSVLAAGDAESGATIHEVTTDVDAGPILAQSRVAVLAGDDATMLAARVLAEEHRLLVSFLAEISVGAGRA